MTATNGRCPAAWLLALAVAGGLATEAAGHGRRRTCPAPVCCPPAFIVCPAPTAAAAPAQPVAWPVGEWQRAEQICKQAITACDNLRPFTNAADLGSHLLPIKVQAGRALARVRAGVGDAEALGREMSELAHRMAAADGYINDMLERSAATEPVLLLMTARAGLAAVLGDAGH